MDSSDTSLRSREPWAELSRHTSARIALGRTGGSVRTEALLDFRLSHARAKDAVSMHVDAAELERRLCASGLETMTLATRATDRAAYLARPDLGRSLDEKSRARLVDAFTRLGTRDLSIIISDGLSALAAERQTFPTLVALMPLLQSAGWTSFPIFVVPFARVKLQDEIGETLGSRHALMLIGERPGLGSPDSLGAYFTHRPCATCTDADRNCISNIRPEGLPPTDAARKIAHLLLESARLGVSGVALKDNAPSTARLGSGQ